MALRKESEALGTSIHDVAEPSFASTERRDESYAMMSSICQ